MGFLTSIFPITERIQVFENRKEAKIFFLRHNSENKYFGKKQDLKRYNSYNFGKTRLMQRSGRKRLYDHNLLLRGIFANRVMHKKLGSLGLIFKGCAFIDFGSAILFGDGAPTVRDIFEDKKIKPFLSIILATDVNDPTSAQSHYFDIYQNKNQKLPFIVREIPLAITLPQHFSNLTTKVKGYKKNKAVIYRSTNSGPDLFYNEKTIRKHFQALTTSHKNQYVLYLFNKFVLLKIAGQRYFQIIGEIDTRVGLARGKSTWKYILWKYRKLKHAFKPSLSRVYLK